MTIQLITSQTIKPRYIVDPKDFRKYGSIINQTYFEKGCELVFATSDVVLHGDTKPFGKDLPVNAYVINRRNVEPERAFEIWDENTLNAKHAERIETLKQEANEIPVVTFWDQYECLAPCRERTMGKTKIFHVMTRVTGNLVNWNALIAGKAYTLVDEADADMDHIIDRFFELVNGLVESK